MSNPYSSEKMAWWAMREGFPPGAPKQVQLIISDLCNQSCSFCAYRMDGNTSNQLFTAGSALAPFGHNNPKRFIPTDKVFEILRYARAMGVLGAQFTGGGEPTVHPAHEAIFQEALDLGLKSALVSNGYRWSDRLIDETLPRFSWVRVSIDAGYPDSYARIRQTPLSAWKRTWDNVRRLAEVIDATNSECVLGIGFVVIPENYTEIDSAIALARDSGAAYIRLSAMFSPEDDKPYRPIYDAVRQSIHEARDAYETATFKIHDLFGDRVEDLREKAPDYELCSYQHYNTYIGGDQNVYRCCVLAYNERGLLGSIKDRTFQAFWEDPETREKLKNFDARGCDRCQFNGKNRVMNYLMSGRPTHIEFP